MNQPTKQKIEEAINNSLKQIAKDMDKELFKPYVDRRTPEEKVADEERFAKYIIKADAFLLLQTRYKNGEELTVSELKELLDVAICQLEDAGGNWIE